MTFEDDETFERELFARRAGITRALEPTELDFEAVVARASRTPERAALVSSAAWITMAAALFIVARASALALPVDEVDHKIASEMEAPGVCKGAALEESACVDPSKMICEVTFGACRP